MADARSLDHFAIAVRDADAAGDRYERLGFQVLPLMRHIEIGSCNRVIQLQQTYLEFVGDLEWSSPGLRERMLPRFECGEGLAIVSLTASDLKQDFERLRAMGFELEPISNARRVVVMPDGRTEETDSHCVYVWRKGRLYTTLFFSEHRKPHTIWVPPYQNHPNTAERVTALIYVSQNPSDETEYVSSLLGTGPSLSRPDRVTFMTPRGERIEFLSPDLLGACYGEALPPWCPALSAYGVALEVAVSDLGQCRKVLDGSGVGFDVRRDRVRVAARDASGVVLDFLEALPASG